MATGSHVVMAAVQARAVAVGRRGVEWGGVCRWQTMGSQLQKASASWHLVRHPVTHVLVCVFESVEVCIALYVFVCGQPVYRV